MVVNVFVLMALPVAMEVAWTHLAAQITVVRVQEPAGQMNLVTGGDALHFLAKNLIHRSPLANELVSIFKSTLPIVENVKTHVEVTNCAIKGNVCVALSKKNVQGNALILQQIGTTVAAVEKPVFVGNTVPMVSVSIAVPRVHLLSATEVVSI